MFHKQIAQIAFVSLIASCFLAAPQLAQAGCGCDKPPPQLAEVRPNVTYAGTEVSLFHSDLEPGKQYTVTFTSGTTNTSRLVMAVARA